MSPSLQGTGWLRDRPTLDVVVIMLTVVVGIVVVGATATVAVIEIVSPTVDTDEVVSLLDAHVGTILGALIGLLVGQAAGRRERETVLR